MERCGPGDLLGGYIMGADPMDVDRMQDLLIQAGYLGWRNFWIEPACWEIVGKKLGKPVYEVLGGKARPIMIYSSNAEMHEPEKRMQEFLAMRARGFTTAKIRVKNRELKDDIRHVEVISKGGVDACRARRRPCSPHTWTNGIGYYINWNPALADTESSLPLEYPLEEPSWTPESREGIIAPIIPDENARLAPFTGPGLGFETGKRLLHGYGTRFFRLKVKVIGEKGVKTAPELKKRKEGRGSARASGGGFS